MIRNRTRLAALAGFFLWHCALSAAEPAARRAPESGVPFVKWFSPQDYLGTPQVFSIEQDGRGILYFGLSSGGLREYDGTSWRVIPTPHNAIVRSLARGADGRLFVGEVGDFGYLQPDATGEMHYVSLLEFVPKEDREFQDVRRIHPTPQGIYFQSFERLFLLTPDGAGWRTKVWKPSTRFRYSFNVFGTVYVAESAVGLRKMNGESLETLPLDGVEKSADAAVMAMLPYSQESRQILVATADSRLHILDSDRALRPFPVEPGAWQKLGTSTAAAALPDGGFGFGRRSGGLLILNHDGATRRYLDRNAGIASDGVLAVFNDRSGTIWLGLQNGIAKVEESSPFTEYGRAAGLSAAVNDIARYRGVLHVATMAGLKTLEPSGEFRPVRGLEAAQVFGLLAHDDTLLATAAREGIFQVSANGATPAISSKPGTVYFSMARSVQDPNRVWLGTGEGLAAMRREPSGRWVDEGLVAKTSEVRSFAEPEPGLLWLGTMSQGAVRVTLRNGTLQNPEVKRFGKADGLPGVGGVYVAYAAGRVVLATPDGVREYDAQRGGFVPSPLFGSVPTGGAAEEYSVTPDAKGNIWVNFGVRPVLLVKQPDGSYQPDESRARRIGDGVVQAMRVDPGGLVWMGGVERIFRYDPAKVRATGQRLPVLIRRVIAGDRQKKVLFAGGGAPGIGVIAYKDNEVRFECSVASFEDPGKNLFQSKLENFDSDWSAWTTENRRDYTNLPPGQFRFVVRARNALAEETTEAEYLLEVLPPWYRAWWAFVIYAILLLTVILSADSIIRRRVIAMEREKSILREAQLRAETAAAEAKTLQAENERNKNVQMLSEIGKDLTSSLDLSVILFKLYEHVSRLMDASLFAAGVPNPERHEIDFRLVVQNGQARPGFSIDARNPNSFAVWCLQHRETVALNDATAEFRKYTEVCEDSCLLHGPDGEPAPVPASQVYLPLLMKGRVLGIFTVQSAARNAYTEYHLDLLRNLASYTAIALDNAEAYLNLKTAQDQLVVQEKLASLGALTAGIAHEIKNPLNFVNNFADLSVELMEELREEVEKLKSGETPDVENMEDLLDDLTGNARKINEHGKRADGIVKSMLLHSRGQAGERQPTDINAMLDEYTSLAYHGMRAQDAKFNATIERQFAKDLGKIDAIPQDLSRVFLNILNNACYAINDKVKKLGTSFGPKLSVRTVDLGEMIEVRIRDNGMGIPPEVRDKIFNPFFTTKPTGQGTGLGLSISHQIVVQEHSGQLEVDSEAGQFTEFVVRLPRQWRKAS